jgi:hypothetical protein
VAHVRDRGRLDDTLGLERHLARLDAVEWSDAKAEQHRREVDLQRAAHTLAFAPGLKAVHPLVDSTPALTEDGVRFIAARP